MTQRLARDLTGFSEGERELTPEERIEALEKQVRELTQRVEGLELSRSIPDGFSPLEADDADDYEYDFFIEDLYPHHPDVSP